VIITLTEDEYSELQQYDLGPFGLKSFDSFMAEVCARIDDTTYEIDMDRDDFEKIALFKQRGHKQVLERIFKRGMDKAFVEFFGPAWNEDTPEHHRPTSRIHRRFRIQ